jgi:poly(3-hydroxybutyrate) depolymerase
MLPSGWPILVSGGVADLELPSQRRPFRLSLPTSYGAPASRPPPLLLAFHGHGGAMNASDVFHAHGLVNGYIVASPLGFDDNGTALTSWNGVGTVASPGPNGRTCYDPTNAFAGMCYRSCGSCADSCWWTTCEDSVAQVRMLLDELSRALCFDTLSVFASGVSNGGMFLYELARSDLANAFAGFMPVVGSPHWGFNAGPARAPVPFFGTWGRADTTIPSVPNLYAPGHPGDPDATLDTSYHPLSQGGWLFTSARAVSSRWALANGCDGASANASSATPGTGCADGDQACEIARVHGADCEYWRTGCAGGASVVACLHPLGHLVPAWVPAAHWAFLEANLGGRRSSKQMPQEPAIVSLLTVPSALGTTGTGAVNTGAVNTGTGAATAAAGTSAVNAAAAIGPSLNTWLSAVTLFAAALGIGFRMSFRMAHDGCKPRTTHTPYDAMVSECELPTPSLPSLKIPQQAVKPQQGSARAGGAWLPGIAKERCGGFAIELSQSLLERGSR